MQRWKDRRWLETYFVELHAGPTRRGGSDGLNRTGRLNESRRGMNQSQEEAEENGGRISRRWRRNGGVDEIKCGRRVRRMISTPDALRLWWGGGIEAATIQPALRSINVRYLAYLCTGLQQPACQSWWRQGNRIQTGLRRTPFQHR
jgi:hypothetical protein